MAAVAAMKAGRLDDETFPVEAKKGKDIVIIDTDEPPIPYTTMEKLAKLPPVFGHRSTVTGQTGSVTAGNAPGINDG